MRNEWRSNLWIVIELVIVVTILWYIFAGLCGLVHARMRYYGYNMDDTFMGYIGRIPKDSPLYQPYDSMHNALTDRDMLLQKLRSNPHVAQVAIGMNAYPYVYSYYGTSLEVMDADSVKHLYYGNLRLVTPDLIRIIQLEGINGESTEFLAGEIEKGNLIISNVDPSYYENARMNGVEHRDDIFFFNGKDAETSYGRQHVGAIAYGMRRSDYEGLQGGVIYMPMPDSWFGEQIIIRVKPGLSRQFAEQVTAEYKRAGNIYIHNLESRDSLREEAHVEISRDMRDSAVSIFFLLAVIFLGFLGNFWFRTQQRVSEIAVRKVNGATDRDIFSRFIGEGMLLLTVGTLIALPVEWLLVHYGIVDFSGEWDSSSPVEIESAVITFVVMSLLIVLGIWFPGRRAMSVNPSQSIKDQ